MCFTRSPTSHNDDPDIRKVRYKKKEGETIVSGLETNRRDDEIISCAVQGDQVEFFENLSSIQQIDDNFVPAKKPTKIVKIKNFIEKKSAFGFKSRNKDD